MVKNRVLRDPEAYEWGVMVGDDIVRHRRTYPAFVSWFKWDTFFFEKYYLKGCHLGSMDYR